MVPKVPIYNGCWSNSYHPLRVLVHGPSRSILEAHSLGTHLSIWLSKLAEFNRNKLQHQYWSRFKCYGVVDPKCEICRIRSRQKSHSDWSQLQAPLLSAYLCQIITRGISFGTLANCRNSFPVLQLSTVFVITPDRSLLAVVTH